MPSRPWYPFYPADYLSDTEDLSLEAHGLYQLLLHRYWIDGGPLPADPVKLARRCRIDPRSFRRLWPDLRRYFENSNGELRNRKMDKILAETKEIQKVRQDAGRRGGLAKARNLLKQPQPHPYINKKKGNGRAVDNSESRAREAEKKAPEILAKLKAERGL